MQSPWEKLERYKPPSFLWLSVRKFSAPSRPERIADVEDSLRMLSLLNAFRTRGHLVANLDPLGRGLGPLVKVCGYSLEFYHFTTERFAYLWFNLPHLYDALRISSRTPEAPLSM
jgi:2-oxoglutarate dehydrogenase complex dehydrogenase (E1) component-like enzyme